PPARIQHLEHGEPHQLLGLEVVLGLVAGGDEAPALLPDSTMEDVVAGAPLRIAKDLIGFTQLAKPCLVAGLTVVRMKPLRQQTIDTMNGLRLGVRADLKNLVVIRSRICRQRVLPPSIPATRCIGMPAAPRQCRW